MYLNNINITKHVLQSKLKNKKAILYCCFTWIVFIELDFKVAFLLRKKAWDDRFPVTMGSILDF